MKSKMENQKTFFEMLTGITHYHAQLELLDKYRAIKGFVVFNNWEVSTFINRTHIY